MRTIKSLFLIISIFWYSGMNSYSADIHVGSGQTYSTIQEAVNNANAGDNVIIHAGTYREEVRIEDGHDNITIQPNGSDTVIINGCEPLLNWTDEGNGVYSTIMDWDVTEGEQTNQLFVDGKMIYFARWPNQTSDDFVMAPTLATMNGVEQISWNKGGILDFEFEDEDTTRWEGASIYINLSNPKCKRDGQGWTGPIIDIVDGKIHARAGGSGRYKSCGNWHIGNGSRYYLFNPTPSAVAASGGVSALLSNGEWWKHNDTLYIKMPDGGAPASSLGEANLVEAKKYPYAFRPEAGGTFSNVTIKDLHLFATSITTDDDYFSRLNTSSASNNVFDNLNVKYVTHSYDCSGDFQVQWNGQSGLILSGTNNMLKNSTIVYSSASAVSVIGEASKVYNCFIHDVNYMVTEAGAINFGKRNVETKDHNVGYNTIFNTTHAGISIRNIVNSDSTSKGMARVHHNHIYNACARAYDAAFLDEAGENKNWMRIDHNILHGAPEFLQIGIYVDWGLGDPSDIYKYVPYRPARFIIDHNVIYDIGFAIAVNGADDLWIWNNTIREAETSSSRSIGTGFDMDKHAQNAFLQNNFAAIHDDWKVNGIVTNNVNPSGLVSTYFTDPDNGGFTLTADALEAIDSGVYTYCNDHVAGSAPDIGAYEYGKPAWEAGAKTAPIVLHQLTVTANNGEVFPASGLYREGERVTLAPKDILGYTFDHWSGDVSSTDEYVEITMDSSITATANFTPIPTYQLNIDHANGTIKQWPEGSEFNQGTEVKIKVSPDSNIYKFTGWTGYVTDTSETITVVMNSNINLTANFELKEIYTLTPTVTNGSIRLNPEGGEYLEGTTVNVFAIPDTGYAFSHWTGDTSLVSDVSRQDIVMDHDMSITAHFEPTGIEGLIKNNDVEIYPNPNDGSQLTVNAESVDGNMQVSIYNIMGIQLFSEKYTRNNITIPLSKLDTHDGCYIIEISTKNGIIRERLIIQ